MLAALARRCRGTTARALLEHLENVEVERDAGDIGFRLPVQWVCRPDQNFRGFAGTVAAGSVRPGDEIVALPSGRRSKVARIVTADGDLARRRAPARRSR